MARMKKRFNVMLKNDLGDWRKMGQYTRLIKAEEEMNKLIRSDNYEVSIGYTDLHNEYRIDEVVIL